MLGVPPPGVCPLPLPLPPGGVFCSQVTWHGCPHCTRSGFA